jgi:proteasome lid subunit RPN8/RPN11
LEVSLEQKNIVLNNISRFVLEQIKNISKMKKNQECCGVIYENSYGLNVLECENLSEDTRKSFVIDPIYFIEYNVVCVFHSHCVGSSCPSVYDMNCSDELCMPYLIYSLRDDDFYLYENISV